VYVIVDATLVKSNASPRKQEILETEPTGVEDIPEQQTFEVTELVIEASRDPVTRLPKKRKKCVYGYNSHTVVDKTYGLVQKIAVIPADVYDGHMLDSVMDAVSFPEETKIFSG
jgi:hypothetical protein